MMAWLDPLDWHAPAWALLFCIPLALAAWGLLLRRKLASYADASLRPWAVAGTSPLAHPSWRAPAWWLAWAFLALAAAGPRLPLDAPDDAHLAPPHRLTLLVLLDLSASMAATDIAPDRLSRARLELTDLLARLNGESIGLIVFAGRAGLLLPPTRDLALMASALAQATPSLIDTPGSNLAAALDLARTSLPANPHAAVLLLSDGDADSLADSAGEQTRGAAARLKQAGIPLFILGLGTEAGAAIPLADGGFAERDGQPVHSHMAPGLLAALAQATGGRFAAVADGDGDWHRLYDAGIAALPGDPVARGHARAWRELFMWPLAVALALFLLQAKPTRRSARADLLPPREGGGRQRRKPWLRALPLVVLCLLAQPPDRAHAADPSPQRAAWQSYHAGHYGEALARYARLGGFPGQMGAGAAAWQLQDFPAAARHFSAALLLAGTPRERTDALYNLGNAQYGLGRWAVAVAAFRAVLAARPEDARARLNLAQAETRLRQSQGRAPLHSDLRGRHGGLAEGRIDPDWDSGSVVQDLAPTADRPLIERAGRNVLGARLEAEAAAERQAAREALRLESGLRKLAVLQDQPRVLLQRLLLQDRPETPAVTGLSPW
jgi:Ca-activated chloride channel family protein